MATTVIFENGGSLEIQQTGYSNNVNSVVPKDKYEITHDQPESGHGRMYLKLVDPKEGGLPKRITFLSSELQNGAAGTYASLTLAKAYLAGIVVSGVGGGGGVTDHGALTGLGDDDHAQYHNDARSATWLDAARPQVSPVQITEGTATTKVQWSPADVKSAIDQHAAGVTTLDGLTDVVVTTPTNGQVLKFNGTNWINDSDATGGAGSTDLSITNRTVTTLDVASSSGIDATIPAATTLLAGLLVSADKDKLDNIEPLANVTNVANITAAIDATTPKGSIADNDEIVILDSAAANAVKTTLWGTLKAALSSLYVALTGAQTIAGIKTFSSIPVGPTENPVSDDQLARKRYVDDMSTHPYAVPLGNQTDVLTTATEFVFRAPYNCTVVEVMIGLETASSSGAVSVNTLKGAGAGTTIYTTQPSCAVSQENSLSTTQAVFAGGGNTWTKGERIRHIISGAGTGAIGAEVIYYLKRTL